MNADAYTYRGAHGPSEANGRAIAPPLHAEISGTYIDKSIGTNSAVQRYRSH